MKARNLAGPQPTVGPDDRASEAAALLSRVDTSGLLVAGDPDGFVGILSDEDLLRALLPSYVEEARTLARVLEEAAADALWRRLEGKRVRDLLDPRRRHPPLVRGDDTLIEVAEVMVRAHARLVGVVEGDRLIGGITIDHLLSHLLGRR